MKENQSLVRFSVAKKDKLIRIKRTKRILLKLYKLIKNEKQMEQQYFMPYLELNGKYVIL